MRQVPQVAVDFVREVEGVRLISYVDVGGVFTVGVGHTGPEVKPGMHITQRMADLYLKEDLGTAAKRLYNVVTEPVILSLTDNQYSALLSFVFNLGAQPSWKIWKRLNERNFDAVPGEMIRFVNAGGKKVQGLVNRRTKEIALWSTDEPGSVPDHPSSAATRSADTPPTPGDQPKRAGVITAIIGAIGAIPVAAQNILTAVAPWSAHSTMVQNSVAIVASVAAGAAVLLLALNWLQHERAKL
jgi:lysozyme